MPCNFEHHKSLSIGETSKLCHEERGEMIMAAYSFDKAEHGMELGDNLRTFDKRIC